MPTDPQKLSIPNIAEVLPASGGLPAVRVTTKNAAGTIYLHGGHVTSWTPVGNKDVLWCSQKSNYEAEKPIRGGVPICFPWFGKKADDPTGPPHGYARLMPWELESINHQDGEVTVTVALKNNDAGKKWWPHDFIIRHRVTFGRELAMQLEVTNTGHHPFTFQEAQHTYFAVGDVRKVRVSGLAGVNYRSDIDGSLAKPRPGDILITAETDRIYLDTQAPVVLEDPSLNRRITMNKLNSKNTVIWNPWIAKAKNMPDFGDDEWPEMICMETCNVAEFGPKILPNQTHIMATRLRVDPL